MVTFKLEIPAVLITLISNVSDNNHHFLKQMTRDNQYQLLFPSCLLCSNHSQAPLRSGWKWSVSGEPCQKSDEWRCLTCGATGKELVLDDKRYKSPCTVPQPGPWGAASSLLLFCGAAKSKLPSQAPGQRRTATCTAPLTTPTAQETLWDKQAYICKYRQGKVAALDLTLEQVPHQLS